MSEKAAYFNERQPAVTLSAAKGLADKSRPHPDLPVTPLPRAGEGPGERASSE